LQLFGKKVEENILALFTPQWLVSCVIYINLCLR